MNVLHIQVSDASGSMKITVVAEENPFSRAMLLSEECFILDYGAARQIFVWKGKWKSFCFLFKCQQKLEMKTLTSEEKIDIDYFPSQTLYVYTLRKVCQMVFKTK